MKRYPYILKSISEYHAEKNTDSIQDNKFKSKDWDKWCKWKNYEFFHKRLAASD